MKGGAGDAQIGRALGSRHGAGRTMRTSAGVGYASPWPFVLTTRRSISGLQGRDDRTDAVRRVAAVLLSLKSPVQHPNFRRPPVVP
jgi:hypothetical protein